MLVHDFSNNITTNQCCSFVSTVNPLRRAYQKKASMPPIKKLQTGRAVNDHNKVLRRELRRSHREAVVRQRFNNDFHKNADEDLINQFQQNSFKMRAVRLKNIPKKSTPIANRKHRQNKKK